MSTPVKHHSPGFLALVNDAKKRIREIGIEEYKRLREIGEAGQLIDVREDAEWQAAHAAGAIHLSKGVIERDIEKTIPDKNAKLVLYCGGGFRSAQLATALEMLLNHRDLTIQDPDVVTAALGLFRSIPSLGFSDCLILQLARKAGHLPLGTFDRGSAKCEGTQKL